MKDCMMVGWLVGGPGHDLLGGCSRRAAAEGWLPARLGQRVPTGFAVTWICRKW